MGGCRTELPVVQGCLSKCERLYYWIQVQTLWWPRINVTCVCPSICDLCYTVHSSIAVSHNSVLCSLLSCTPWAFATTFHCSDNPWGKQPALCLHLVVLLSPSCTSGATLLLINVHQRTQGHQFLSYWFTFIRKHHTIPVFWWLSLLLWVHCTLLIGWYRWWMTFSENIFHHVLTLSDFS